MSKLVFRIFFGLIFLYYVSEENGSEMLQDITSTNEGKVTLYYNGIIFFNQQEIFRITSVIVLIFDEFCYIVNIRMEVAYEMRLSPLKVRYSHISFLSENHLSKVNISRRRES